MKDYKNIADEELFEYFQISDDKVAFQVLYDRYSKRVFAYCLRTFGNKEIAKDIFQKIMYNIIAKRDNFKGGNFLAWLMIITRNECLMEKRSAKNKEEVTDNTLTSDSFTSTDFYLNEHIHSAVSNLHEDYREIVELRYFDDFSYEEIAKMLNISLSLVKVRLFRAKKQLSLILSPYKELIK
ncbi:MAG: RNA polymerase sigma factor [Candidatus Kapabacteria bacterium]|nr:RNA polymerase sigma factor [Candidatus Kapabacteria bacterium]